MYKSLILHDAPFPFMPNFMVTFKYYDKCIKLQCPFSHFEKFNFCSLHFETNEVEQFMLTPATSSVSPWSDSGRSPMILKMETQAAKEAYELIANIMEINKHNCTLFLKECIHANCTVVGKCWWNYQNISLLFSFLFLGGGVLVLQK